MGLACLCTMLIQDFRYAARGLRKQPGFTLLAVLTLALGIGANTAIFTVADATLRRSLPYPDPDALVTITETRQRAEWTNIEASYPNYLDWHAQSRWFAALAGYGRDGVTLRSQDRTDIAPATVVTADFFRALGVRAALGRTFEPADLTPGAPPVVLLTHATWQARFGGDPTIVGKTLPLDKKPTTVIGVLPRGFAFGPVGESEFYLPLIPEGMRLERRNLHWLNVIARLAPGVSRSQAQAEMSGIAARLAQTYPVNAGAGALVAPLEELIIGKVRPIVFVLWGAVALVLLVACANVANLMLARATSRQRELAIRSALGASRMRLVGQITAESVVIAVIGGAVGLVFAMWGIDALGGFIPPSQLAAMPWLRDLGVDVPALLFAFGVSGATGVLIGVIAALRASARDIRAILADEGRGTAGRARTRLRDVLVVSEVAVAFVLLVGAALIGRSLLAVLSVDPGFDPNRLLTVRAGFSDRFKEDPQQVAAHEELLGRLSSLPGVQGVASVSVLPLTGGGNTIRYVVDGRPEAGRDADFEANIRQVSRNYFQMMGVSLVAGRMFDRSDRLDAPLVVVVNKALAEKVFPGVDPLTQRIRFTYKAGLPPMQIVGVVGDEKIATLDTKSPPAVYASFDQAPTGFTGFLVRAAGDAGALAGSVRAEMNAFDGEMAVFDVMTMEDRIARSPWMFVRRFPAILVGAFAALALVLAVVGLYGVLSYSVGQRTHEIGIRRAVGAQRRDIVRLVLVRAAALVAAGTLAGLAIATAVTGLLRSLLFGVGAHDPPTLVAAAALLALVALVACWVPVRRALKVDPMEALR